VRPLGIASIGMNGDPDFARVANVLIRVVVRVLVHEGTHVEGESNADLGLLSSVH
jgi:hypothetical protein